MADLLERLMVAYSAVHKVALSAAWRAVKLAEETVVSRDEQWG